MRIRKIVFSTAIMVGLIAMVLVPGVAQADTPTPTPTATLTPGQITFHLSDGINILEQEDSVGTITLSGQTNNPNGLVIYLSMLCIGENCKQVDVYYRINTYVAWSNGYNDRDMLTYQFGSTSNVMTIHDGLCGTDRNPADPLFTGRSGSCSFTNEGTIPAADIPLTSGIGELMYLVNSQFLYGGQTHVLVYDIVFSTSPIPGSGDCSGQYIIGSGLGSMTVPANSSAGVNMQAVLGSNTPANGSYYSVTVTGTWKNNGAGSDLQDVGMRNGISGNWVELGNNQYTECTKGHTYYLQMGNLEGSVLGGTVNGSPYFRVYDTDGNWASNTGSLVLTFSNVSARTRYESGCELQYEIGDLIEQQTVNAAWDNGQALAYPDKLDWPTAGGGAGQPVPKRYYMLETMFGPANLGAAGYTYHADLAPLTDVKDQSPSTWYPIETAPFVECVVSTDEVGHVKVFFALDEQTDLYTFIKHYYAFRIHDDASYLDNSGTLTYTLYQAQFMQTTVPGDSPSVNGCMAYSHAATATATVTIPANNSIGVPLPTLTNRALYAFQISAGPWMEGGSVSSYAIEISDDNGATWKNMISYPNLLCAQAADGMHAEIYVYGAAGKIWKARVHDLNGNFLDNTGTIDLIVYSAATGIDMWPTCNNDYTLTQIPLGSENAKVPGNDAAGKTLTGIVAGKLYSILITDQSVWYEAGTGAGSYLVDISSDGGTTWVNLEDAGLLCAEQVSEGRFQIWFTAVSNTYKLRVRDGDNNFLSNTGYVVFNLYTAQDTANPPPSGDTGTPSPEWVVACNESYSRPNSFLSYYPIGTIGGVTISVPIPRVAEWIDYLRSSITYYFAWCPVHTAALGSIGTALTNKEPIVSILQMMNFAKNIQTTLEAYKAGGGAGESANVSQEPDLFSDTSSIGVAGGSGTLKVPTSITPWDIFSVGDLSTSVWYGGHLDMAASLGTTDLSSMNGYQTLCTGKFYSLLGIGANPFCWLMASMRYSDIVMWLLLGLDLMLVVWWFFKYMPGYFKRWYYFLSGNKPTINKMTGS